MNRFFPFPSILLYVVLLALASCAGVPERTEAPDPLAASAEALASQGDYLAAAQLYLNRLQTAPRVQHAALRMTAGDYLARGELWEQLATLLARIDAATLDPQQQMRYQQLLAGLSLSQHRSEQALAQLEKISTPELLPDQGRQYYRLRAEAYAMAGNAQEAVRQLIWLDGLLTDSAARLENQYRIWDQLSTLPDLTLQQLAAAPQADAFSGWAELVLISRRSRGDRQQWTLGLENWSARYPSHAAQAVLLPDLSSQMQRAGIRAQQVAVLLPLSGKTEESAAAIRDGILAAWFQEQQDRPELRFYDTAGNPQLLWSLYQQAVQDGAQFVIGPLLKESVEQLAMSGELPVPVLALNSIDNDPRPDLALYQFGLTPEDEARQVAEKAFRDGHRHLVALVPDTTWGARVFAAFAQHFTTLGGEVRDVGRYAPDSADFKGPIQQIFNLAASKNRHRALERLFGQKLQFELRRRQDVDAVLLLGFPEQARQIFPQLVFHHAGDLPVYGTSHVFSATTDRRLDRDINGLQFCDMPWVLDNQGNWVAERDILAAVWPERSKRYPRLFALGFDAWQIVPWLDTLSLPGFASFPGATGVITLGAGKHLQRALDWAQFDNGVPRKLPGNTDTLSMEGQHEPTQSGGGPR